MIKTELLDDVMDALLEDGDVELTPELKVEIENSTACGIMDRYLSWHGIIGYTEQILDAIDTINKADDTHYNHDVVKLMNYMWADEMTHYMEQEGLDEEDAAIAHALKGGDHIFCTLARLHNELSDYM